MSLEITRDNFQEEVLNSSVPVLIDFWATWCAPCRMLSPTIDEIAAERSDVKVCKCNVDTQLELARMMNVRGIPMLVLFKKGQPTGTLVGVRPKEEILQFIDQ